MSVILTSMLLVLGGAILLAEIFAPFYVRWWFKGFPAGTSRALHRDDPHPAARATALLRRWSLGSVMLVRKQFALQAVTPLIYNLGIIFGGVFLARLIGIRSLAWGALAGVFIGPFLMNAIGAHRAGVRYRPILDWSNPGLREWVRLSIPLMLGVSLVSFDSWIMNYFASGDRGAITLLAYAKSLFTAPVALGQAAGAASLPFLASLFTKNDPDAFSRNVNSSVSRVVAFSLLLTGWMIGLAFPLVDLIFRGGLFHRTAPARWPSTSRSSPSRSASGRRRPSTRAPFTQPATPRPMVAGTLVVLVSLPIYWSLYRAKGATGLAIASDIGIVIQTVSLAVLLHHRKMVALSGLHFKELARSAFAALAGFGSIYLVERAHARQPEGDGTTCFCWWLLQWLGLRFRRQCCNSPAQTFRSNSSTGFANPRPPRQTQISKVWVDSSVHLRHTLKHCLCLPSASSASL